MSESAGGTTLAPTAVSDTEIEVRLKFVSRDYTPVQLATRIQDVDSLVKLLVSPRAILNGRPVPANPARRAAGSLRGRGVARRQVITSSVRGHGSYSIRAGAGKWTPFGLKRGAKITVESVSLHSPLEITLLVTYVTANVLARFGRLIPKLIEIKNSWHGSQVIAAESRTKIAAANLDTQIINKLAEDVGNIDLDKYGKLKKDHPSKRIVNGAVRALTDLDSAEVRQRK
ncbi:hypothetical protein QF038_001833 [Pseudarthrobacter sp. W1I19]|uniref:hypothetical protein n=1 Tax=Pseudarthrobacter sp. W1I19 TaxID=3042288 RepID=UPI00278AACBE|nr:hypothetical protein [Pseudarthrobacter sp. W1I19]MDQ0923325.1 hypothetical protein [Pseudarthrobacter sp. W1I19]